MRRLLAAAMLIGAGVLGLGPGGASAAPAAPVWTIEAIPFPTAFQAGAAFGALEEGPGYLVQAYNVGGEATTATFTLTDVLPKGMLPASGFPPSGLYGPQLNSGANPAWKLSCSTLGRKITCTGGGEGPVGPGDKVSVVVPVQTDAAASGVLSDKATIEGGGAAGVTESLTPTPISATPSAFGFIEGPGLYGSATGADGSPATLAGSHPYQMTIAGMNLATNPGDLSTLLAAGGGLREATVSLPRGEVVDPGAVPQCKESQLENGTVGCPDASQVGTVALALSLQHGFGQSPSVHPVYNMVPPPGYPASLGFEVVEGTYEHLLGSVSSDGTFTLSARAREALARVTIGGVRTTLWGEPSDESHDAQRGVCLFSTTQLCPVERTRKAFLTMPAACSGPLATTAHILSWLDEKVVGSYLAPDAIEGCSSLEFRPTIEARPSTQQADSPAGLEFDLRQSQNREYENENGEAQRATAPLENTTVALPEGMALNPSAANGRQACTAAEIGLVSPVRQTPILYQEEPAHCPNASKVGSAEVITPLLEKEDAEGNRIPRKLHGAIYLAKPFDNPFGSLLAIYLVLEDEETGIIAKLAGRVEPDPATGQLRTTFEESPQLPLEDVHLSFFDGPRAALTTPLTCGTKTTTGALTPWSTSTPTAASDSFQITDSCSASEATAPRNLSFSAGTTSPLAGSYSPFVLKLTRPDGTQRISSIDTSLPEGLTGRLAGTPYCSDAQIAQAEGRSHPEEGKLERQQPSCPSASEVGTATVAAGSGSNPVYVIGHAYLAGPYKGAPLSMVIITPAVTGPFDLGVVVVRVALEVDPETARITAKSDPLPTILDGIPLDVRSIALSIDRSGFILNPTNCDASQITAAVSSPAGSSTTLSERFGVEGCNRLAFKPKLKISLKGATKRAGHPALKAVVTYPKKGAYANIARAQVGLPHALFLDQGNLNKTCTRPVLLAGNCPPSTVYGHAKAWTPLLEKPLEGPVYLVGGYGYKLPALVGELNGQIRVLLKGRVDTTKRHGIRNTFEVVPDAPVSRFVLQMKGGKKYSLLENSENLCAKPQKASARFVAQNGRVAQLRPKIAVQCGRKKAKKRHGHASGHHHAGAANQASR